MHSNKLERAINRLNEILDQSVEKDELVYVHKTVIKEMLANLKEVDKNLYKTGFISDTLKSPFFQPKS